MTSSKEDHMNSLYKPNDMVTVGTINNNPSVYKVEIMKELTSKKYTGNLISSGELYSYNEIEYESQLYRFGISTLIARKIV